MASIFPEGMSRGGCVTVLGDLLWAGTTGAHSSSQGLPRWLSGKKYPPAMQEIQEMWVRSLGQEDPLEKEMATHSSILAWKIP